MGAPRALQVEFAMGREVRAKRTAVSYTASEVGSLASGWEPIQSHDAALAQIEAELAKLNAHVAALRALRTSIVEDTWVPRHEDL